MRICGTHVSYCPQALGLNGNCDHITLSSLHHLQHSSRPTTNAWLQPPPPLATPSPAQMGRDPCLKG